MAGVDLSGRTVLVTGGRRQGEPLRLLGRASRQQGALAAGLLPAAHVPFDLRQPSFGDLAAVDVPEATQQATQSSRRPVCVY